MDKEKFTETVINGIERIIFEGESGEPQNFVTFVLSNEAYYLQILAARGAFSVFCEAAANVYVEPKDHISTSQIKQLMALGWSEAVGENNHSMQHSCESISDRQKLAELFYETASIYGCDAIDSINLHIA